MEKRVKAKRKGVKLSDLAREAEKIEEESDDNEMEEMEDDVVFNLENFGDEEIELHPYKKSKVGRKASDTWSHYTESVKNDNQISCNHCNGISNY